MRISDWSSDVCSSDLAGAAGIEVYYGWTNKCHDLGCENDRTRALKFNDGRNAIAFFNEYVGERALGMVADDDLTLSRTEYVRSEEHTSELQSLMRISYAVFCLKKKKKYQTRTNT